MVCDKKALFYLICTPQKLHLRLSQRLLPQVLRKYKYLYSSISKSSIISINFYRFLSLGGTRMLTGFRVLFWLFVPKRGGAANPSYLWKHSIDEKMTWRRLQFRTKYIGIFSLKNPNSTFSENVLYFFSFEAKKIL